LFFAVVLTSPRAKQAKLQTPGGVERMASLPKVPKGLEFWCGGLLLTVALAGCGEAPRFLDKQKATARTGDEPSGAQIVDNSGDATAAGDDTTAGDKEGSDDQASSTTTPTTIPTADPKDLDALHKCLASWKDNPFTGTVSDYRKITAAVTVGGFGNAINDTENTDKPFLTLIDAGVNVLGAPTYNLLNKNGYYCMKVNVNVLTDLTVNLHCNARLADARVDINVLSQQNDATSGVGVHVLSNVHVETVRPQGDTCIR